MRSSHLVLIATLLAPLPPAAFGSEVDGDKAVRVDGLEFSSSLDFVQSEYFQAGGFRCGTPTREVRELLYPAIELLDGSGADCSATGTNPTPDWNPDVTLEIPVVFHVITNATGTQGVVTTEAIESQIEILNEDFLALMGTNGADGNNALIQFVLAGTTGPHANTTWFNDGGASYNTLAWDPNNFLNIYTNNPGDDTLGYVPFLPADGGGILVGGNADRVVLYWESVGRDGAIPPYHQGRTATHEVGHYLGLEHTFSPDNGTCPTAAPPGCYTSGDLICDTDTQSGQVLGCPGGAMSCGSAENLDNYMNYTDDLCMEQFTVEQVRRSRCTLINYRPDLYEIATGEIFADGFETGDTTAW